MKRTLLTISMSITFLLLVGCGQVGAASPSPPTSGGNPNVNASGTTPTRDINLLRGANNESSAPTTLTKQQFIRQIQTDYKLDELYLADVVNLPSGSQMPTQQFENVAPKIQDLLSNLQAIDSQAPPDSQQSVKDLTDSVTSLVNFTHDIDYFGSGGENSYSNQSQSDIQQCTDELQKFLSAWPYIAKP